MEGYRIWRNAHPNLLVDGFCYEWCNDLMRTMRRMEGKAKSLDIVPSPESKAREDALRKFLGECPKTRYEQLDLMKRY